jgi:uncharacterized membrane protein YidH (DUF202 family)
MSHADTPANDASQRSEGGGVRRAGAFDIRTFIGSLIGIYGVVLVIVGLVGTSDKQLAKSNQLNINLWAGIGMVVVAVFFLVWARLRPVVIPPHPEEAD